MAVRPTASLLSLLILLSKKESLSLLFGPDRRRLEILKHRRIFEENGFFFFFLLAREYRFLIDLRPLGWEHSRRTIWIVAHISIRFKIFTGRRIFWFL